jgi:hypothetical protein
MNINDEPEFNERILRKKIYECRIKVPLDIKVSEYKNDLYRDMAYQFCVGVQAAIYYEELESKVIQEHSCLVNPKTWWDHFKQDCMPKWFTDMFPIKYETQIIPEIKANFKAMYPDYSGIHDWNTPYIRFSEWRT